MTPKSAQLLLALEPGVPYDVWEAARRAGIKAAHGVTLRAANLGTSVRTWVEDGVKFVCRELPGYCLLSVWISAPVTDSWSLKSWETLSVPDKYVDDFAVVGHAVVAVLKRCAVAFVYHHRDVSSLFPMSNWERVSPAAIEWLARSGVLVELAQDELATFYEVSPLVIPPQRGRRRAAQAHRRTSEPR